MNRKHDVPLSELTTMRVGGPAKYLFDVDAISDINIALETSAHEKIPIAILGGGSNILPEDTGFAGVLLRSADTRIEYDERSNLVVVGAGASWDAFVAAYLERGYSGLENLSGIPGTVGASPVQNIGAYGKEVGESIKWVEAYDLFERRVVCLERNACAFGYRESIFKRRPEFFIMRVAFMLEKKTLGDIRYKDLSAWFSQKPTIVPTPLAIREAVLDIRGRKFPDLTRYGTAGSFFKNPIVPRSVANRLRERFPEAPLFPMNDGTFKTSAAWLIDHAAHMRGSRDGDVGSWERQALVLVNYGKATAQEVSEFADDVALAVWSACGIRLEREVVPLTPIEYSLV
jgi:UDP-N-acetylmuramate dehydrogenase